MVKIRLGYACINMNLSNELCGSRTATHKTIIKLGEKIGIEYLKSLAIKNVQDLLTTLEWNEKNNIKFFRITSCIFPHLGDRTLIQLYPDNGYLQGDIEFARPYLIKVGDFAKMNKHRLTFHSHPYTQLGSPTAQIIINSIFDLRMFYKTFKMMDIEPSPYNCVILHGGGVYGDKSKTIERINQTLNTLDPAIKKMLVFENDERHYNPIDLLEICELQGMPLCFDIFHNAISKNHVEISPELMKRIIRTWNGYIPKFHISEQRPGERFGAHSDYVTELPKWLFELPIDDLDLMLECKQKEKSVLLIYQKYPDFF